MHLHCDDGGLQHLQWDLFVGVHANIVDGLQRSVFLVARHHTCDQRAPPRTDAQLARE